MGLTSDDEMDYVSPYVTPEGSGPTSKVTSVSHSPPSAKKHSIHSTMSVPANLKEAAEHLNPERRLFIGCIDEVRFVAQCGKSRNCLSHFFQEKISWK